jgi:hypothetical protein
VSRTSIPEADHVALLAYLDGALSEEERIRFELRLADEPALAAAYEEIADVDGLLRSAERARAIPRRSAWRTWVPFALAAAALAAFGVWALLGRSPRPSFTCEVAVLPSSLEFDAYDATLGLDPRLHLRGGGTRGADTEGLGPTEYVEVVQRAERERRQDALARATLSTRAPYYTIPFRASSPCSALVLSITRTGAVAREYPRRDRPEWPANWHEPGTVHVLPREVIRLADGAGGVDVELDPGFLVPIGVRELDVLLALRDTPLADALVQELDGWIERESSRRATSAAQARSIVDDLHAWLGARGFEVRRMRVEEP